MVSFSKMWEDVFTMIDEREFEEFSIVEKFKSGFIVLCNGVKEFITKDDFVNFWCRLLYYNEISTDKIKKDGIKVQYVYKFVRKLPYVTEDAGIIKLVG